MIGEPTDGSLRGSGEEVSDTVEVRWWGVRPVSWISLSLPVLLSLPRPGERANRRVGGSCPGVGSLRSEATWLARGATHRVLFDSQCALLSVCLSSPFLPSLYSVICLLPSLSLRSSRRCRLRPCASDSLPLSLLSYPSSSNSAIPPCRSSTWLATLRSGYSATKSPLSPFPREAIYIYTHMYTYMCTYVVGDRGIRSATFRSSARSSPCRACVQE